MIISQKLERIQSQNLDFLKNPLILFKAAACKGLENETIKNCKFAIFCLFLLEMS